MAEDSYPLIIERRARRRGSGWCTTKISTKRGKGWWMKMANNFAQDLTYSLLRLQLNSGSCSVCMQSGAHNELLMQSTSNGVSDYHVVCMWSSGWSPPQRSDAALAVHIISLVGLTLFLIRKVWTSLCTLYSAPVHCCIKATALSLHSLLATYICPNLITLLNIFP